MLPVEFEKRMKALLGEEYSAFSEAVGGTPVRSFRINTKKINQKDFLKKNPFGGEKIPFTENGYYFNYDSVGNHPYHHAGMIYVQEPAAMAAVESVEIQKNWKVLDLCAAPGGKSTQVASKLENGVLVSNEIIPSRCKILTGNIERMGFENVVTTCTDAKRLSQLFREEFDLVIVDAPCSGEGMFRKDDVAVNEWSVENVVHCAKRQEEILEYIYGLVKHDGYLLYSTCTFSLEENEKQIDSFLCMHTDFELVPVSRAVKQNTADGIKFDGCKAENIDYCRRFYPHISKGEGQFIALLKRKSGTDLAMKKENALEKIPKSEEKLIFDFLDDTLTEYDRNAVMKYKGNVVYFKPDFVVPKGIAFSCGVTIGEVKKNYIQPHHQLFSAMGKSFVRRINLTVDEAENYLRGETINCDCKNGWTCVLVDGCPLGGAKAVNGTAKNHYPKGLRKAIR